MITENLDRAFPNLKREEKNRLIKGFYRNLSDVLLETVKLLTISESELKRRIRMVNTQNINKYFNEKRTVIATTSHLCNWEWMLAISSLELKAPIDGVYQKVSNPFV